MYGSEPIIVAAASEPVRVQPAVQRVCSRLGFGVKILIARFDKGSINAHMEKGSGELSPGNEDLL